MPGNGGIGRLAAVKMGGLAMGFARSFVYKGAVSAPRTGYKLALLLVVTLVVIGLDQWTKFGVLRELTTAFEGKETNGERMRVMFSDAPAAGNDELHYQQKRSITVSPNFFRLRYAENPGAAWGLFRTLPEAIRGPLFHIVSIGAVILISFYFSQLSGNNPKERWALWGLPLVLGGALGNYVDRIARGFVIDFLEAHWFDKVAWPSFNVADAAICVGVGMLVLDAFVRREEKHATPVGG
jgi:signal peptidase II